MTRRRWIAAAGVVAALGLVGAGVLLTRAPAPSPPVSTRVLPLVTPAFPGATSAPATNFRIVSKDLKIDLPIVEGDGWTVPYNKAAHYPGMKLPGENGRSMIYAHELPGMFASLASAHVGQEVDIERPGKPLLRYVIREYYPRWPPNDLKYVKPGESEQLVLLTCTSYNANDPRIIAVAEPI